MQGMSQVMALPLASPKVGTSGMKAKNFVFCFAFRSLYTTFAL